MLHEFLQANKQEILKMSEEKTRSLAGVLEASELLKAGLPLFFDQLIHVLEQKLAVAPPKDMLVTAASHGRE